MNRSVSLAGGGKLWLAAPPAQSKGVVLICPGGGYQWLSPREAAPVARAFTAGGWASAVLEYTVRADDRAPLLGKTPLLQLGEAAALLRARYPGLPLAVCGFSAGGHLAASLGVHWKELDLPRPDALVLSYPVITAGRFAHRGSFANLASEEDWAWYSLENQAGPHTPPTFCWHTMTDPEVPVENSLLFANALHQAGVPCELHLYPRGVHGLSLATPEVEEPEKNRLADAHIAGWLALCLDWLNILADTKERAFHGNVEK
ncbi:MAG: alpha/beta hydrolase [Aristaeellaceae bacterium]